MTAPDRMEKIVALCKRRGFIFQSSEIYGGINGFWDYGPLGAELKRNVKDYWWRTMVHRREDVVGLEATIIMHPQIWKASGHVDTFADLMRECPLTKKRVRADQVEPQSGTVFRYTGARSALTGWAVEKAFAVLEPKGERHDPARKKAREFYAQGSMDGVPGSTQNLELLGESVSKVTNSVDFHPESGAEMTDPRPFNLMFKTYVGPVADEEN